MLLVLQASLVNRKARLYYLRNLDSEAAKNNQLIDVAFHRLYEQTRQSDSKESSRPLILDNK